MSFPEGTSDCPFPELFRDEVFRLETRRLWLRWPCLGDAARLHEIASLEAVARPTATWPHPLPAGEAALRIERARASNATGQGLLLALTDRREPTLLIGVIGAGGDRKGSLELGYMLGVEHQGQGVMTEAVRALVEAVFLYTTVRHIRGGSGLANLASRRVMEKACFRLVGRSTRDAPARGGVVPCDELELTREIWRSSATGAVSVPPPASHAA